MPNPSPTPPALHALQERHLRRLLHLSQDFNSTIDLKPCCRECWI